MIIDWKGITNMKNKQIVRGHSLNRLKKNGEALNSSVPNPANKVKKKRHK